MGLLAGNQLLLFFIRERLGITENAGLSVTIALGVFIIVAAAVSIPAGWISDRTDRRLLVVASCIVGMLASLVLLFTTNYTMLLVGFAILGAGTGIFVTADWALAIDLIPDPRAAGLYMGLTNLSTAGGDALASLTAGVILDVFNNIQPPPRLLRRLRHDGALLCAWRGNHTQGPEDLHRGVASTLHQGRIAIVIGSKGRAGSDVAGRKCRATGI